MDTSVSFRAVISLSPAALSGSAVDAGKARTVARSCRHVSVVKSAASAEGRTLTARKTEYVRNCMVAATTTRRETSGEIGRRRYELVIHW